MNEFLPAITVLIMIAALVKGVEFFPRKHRAVALICGLILIILWSLDLLLITFLGVIGITIIGTIVIIIHNRTKDNNWENWSPKRKERTIHHLQTMDWLEFENLVTHIFQHTGYEARRRPRSYAGADQGIDIEARHPKYGDIAIQCKAWNKPVGVDKIREFAGALIDTQKNGIFVAVSGYTEPAKQLANTRRIQLLTGEDVLQVIENLPEDVRTSIYIEIFNADYQTPSCPNCEVKMVLRQGATEFWGCPRYPQCRAKLQIKSIR